MDNAGARYGFAADVDVCEAASPGDHGNTPATATPVGLSTSTSGALTANDSDYFRISVTEAGTLTVFTEGSTDTYGTLTRQDGGQLVENDDSGQGYNFRLSTAVSAGTYFVEVRGYSAQTTGPYTLRVTFTPSVTPGDDHGDTAATATSVGSNSTTAGVLTANDSDYFRLSLSEAGTLTVFTEGSTDTYGTLTRQDGELLVENDDSGPGYNFRLSTAVPAGTYFVEVRGYNAQTTGPYTLRVTFASSAAVDLRGNADTVASLFGQPQAVIGWALDSLNPAAAVSVEIYVDGPVGSGTKVATVTADHPRQDVNDTLGVPGDHGFQWPLSSAYQTGSHEFYVYAVDRASHPTVRTELSSSPLPGPPGGWDFCRAQRPCRFGQGDCDDAGECASGLSCVDNVGADYGLGSGVDVCASSVAVPVGHEDYCRDHGPCGEGEGDCDGTSECETGLRCVTDVGANYGFAPGTDVCEQPSGTVGDWDYCRDYGPCEEGEGDCDGDSECVSGLRCVDNVGANYGFAPGVDVCEASSPAVALRGNIDTVASLFGHPQAVIGWALDTLHPAASVSVEIYVDGPVGRGTKVATVTADQPRQDVNDALGVPGDHGFLWPLSSAYRTGHHEFYVYAVDRASHPTVRTALGSSPMSGPPGGWDFCRDHGPCRFGQGDCDRTSECATGMTCEDNVGADYGLGTAVDVCVFPGAGSSDGGFPVFPIPSDPEE